MMINHLRKVALTALSLMLMGGLAFAQQTISGTVKDAKGEPVIGAGVVVEGTQNGAMTDIDGHWTLSCFPHFFVTFRKIGPTAA